MCALVTGVQTCALPIYFRIAGRWRSERHSRHALRHARSPERDGEEPDRHRYEGGFRKEQERGRGIAFSGSLAGSGPNDEFGHGELGHIEEDGHDGVEHAAEMVVANIAHTKIPERL